MGHQERVELLAAVRREQERGAATSMAMETRSTRHRADLIRSQEQFDNSERDQLNALEQLKVRVCVRVCVRACVFGVPRLCVAWGTGASL